ncbi:hypothetical protein BGW38_000561 [Lunasporangiospora selenospora]|uniref:Uncharacterized protein n=1 Tax=Lunasporangiospora selenospora TaxID=979761 RepID=A0A9P6FUN9_9FUNG|nr:hypothetical protein BGW38_000561 [Lunasporangiospora selenospora]
MVLARLSGLLGAALVGLGYLTSLVHADSLEFESPLPNTKIATGQSVPLTYKIHQNGMTRLDWVMVHLMTEDGQDAGMGTLDYTSREQWQPDSLSISLQAVIPRTLPEGRYVFHIFGRTEEPCEAATARQCEGILSATLPVEVVSTSQSSSTLFPEASNISLIARARLLRRTLFSSRRLGGGRSGYLLGDGSIDSKKTLYMFSLI